MAARTVPDPDRNLVTSSSLSPVLTNFVPSDSVPKAVGAAVCEMARELLLADRTAAPPGEGVEAQPRPARRRTMRLAGRVR